MAKKTTETAALVAEKPSLDAFREAIKQVLMKESSAPELVALALIESEDDYIRNILDNGWGVHGKTASLVLEVASEIAIREPANKPKWILLDEGMSLVEEGAMHLDTSGPVAAYLDALVELGLHGETRQEAALAMMVRGIESVSHMLPPRSQFGKR